jgi:hypothetical protein
MMPDKVISIVGNRCRPDQDEKLNRWYVERHIPDLLQFKGLQKATRYQVLYPDLIYPGYPEVKYPKYITVFDYKSQADFDAYEVSPAKIEAGKNVRETWEKDPMERVWRVQYKFLGTYEQTK